jgi:hypothetical protein
MTGRVIVAVCVVGLLSVRAQAKEDDAITARKAFDRATKLFEDNKYVEAVEAFELAYRLRPHFRVQCSIARCHQIMGDAVEAVAHYKRCLEEGAASSPMKKDIEKMLKDAEALITWINVRSPGGGGKLFVDDMERGRAPGRVAINPGTHVIRVERAGAEPVTAKIKTLGGEERDLTLIPVVTGEARPDKGKKEKEKEKKGGGRHRRLSPVWFWTVVGVTAALAVGTIVAGAMTRQARNDYNDDPTKDGLDTFKSRKTATNVLFGATMAAAASGTALFFFTDFRGKGGKERPTEDDELVLGVGLRGTF